MAYRSAEEYLTHLEKRAALPRGFSTAMVDLTFRPIERPVPQPLSMRLNLLLLDEPSSAFAGMFTRNPKRSRDFPSRRQYGVVFGVGDRAWLSHRMVKRPVIHMFEKTPIIAAKGP